MEGSAPEAPDQVVALRYERDSKRAPDLVAKGRGELARRILEVAAAHGVPARQDPDLVSLLAACDLGEEVPVELYGAVAALFVYLYELNEELAGERRD